LYPKRIIDWAAALIFVLFFLLWARSQPFFSVERFKQTELNYRKCELFRTDKRLTFSEQLLSALNTYPDAFLKTLEKEYPSRADAEAQLERDRRRTQAQVEIYGERKKQCEEDIKWIDLIERQIMGQ
jgi:hypothetical protein